MAEAAEAGAEDVRRDRSAVAVVRSYLDGAGDRLEVEHLAVPAHRPIEVGHVIPTWVTAGGRSSRDAAGGERRAQLGRA